MTNELNRALQNDEANDAEFELVDRYLEDGFYTFEGRVYTKESFIFQISITEYDQIKGKSEQEKEEYFDARWLDECETVASIAA